MKILPLLFVFLFTFHFSSGLAQDYDIVIRGGHVIDAKNNIDKIMDIAVKDGKISKEMSMWPMVLGRLTPAL